MAIEVIVRHEYNAPKYLTKCYKCKSILRFTESDIIDDENFGYSLTCPVCGYANTPNTPGLKIDWEAETERLKGELNV